MGLAARDQGCKQLRLTANWQLSWLRWSRWEGGAGNGFWSGPAPSRKGLGRLDSLLHSRAPESRVRIMGSTLCPVPFLWASVEVGHCIYHLGLVPLPPFLPICLCIGGPSPTLTYGNKWGVGSSHYRPIKLLTPKLRPEAPQLDTRKDIHRHEHFITLTLSYSEKVGCGGSGHFLGWRMASVGLLAPQTPSMARMWLSRKAHAFHVGGHNDPFPHPDVGELDAPVNSWGPWVKSPASGLSTGLTVPLNLTWGRSGSAP